MVIWQVIRETGVQFYEHLFRYVFLNIIGFLLFLPVIVFGYSGIVSGWYLPLIIPVFFTGPIFLAALHIARRVVEDNELVIKDFFINIKTYFKKGLLGFLYSLAVYAVLIVDLIFFLSRDNGNIWMLALAIIVLYFLLIFSASQLYLWGLLAWREDLSFGKVIKQSFLLILDNLLFSLLWLITMIVFIVIITITAVGIPVLMMGVISLLIINGSKVILETY